MASETPQQKHYSPAEPRSSLRSASGRQAGDPDRSARVGPLTIERLRKDDGRALLLYELNAAARR
jgi:hypothetical protein